MKKTTLAFFVAALLLVSFLLALFSIRNDTFTFDETAHIAAGYSYLTQKDYRLNPEHPPLIKDIAAFPLLFLNLNFPKNHPSWQQEQAPQWWTQFDFATQLLYKSGNDPDKILFWSRLMMIFVFIFLGLFLFLFAKRFFDQKTALLALFFYCFSPTFLAHGRLITTDLGASLGVLMVSYFLILFLKKPTIKNIIFAGLIFGLVMLIKFSLILLIPFMGLVVILYAWLSAKEKLLLNILKHLSFLALIFLIGFCFVIWPVYFYHTYSLPPDHQIRDAKAFFEHSSIPPFAAKTNLWMMEQPLLRSLAHYFFGVLMAVNRTTTGNTTFFLGEISANGWKTYFPIVYLIKVPLAFHILSLIGLLYLALSIKKPFWVNTLQRTKKWAKEHFAETTLLCFLLIYWATSINAKLNIGIRHLLPVFPLTFLLVARITTKWSKPPFFKIKTALLAVLLLWQAVSVVSVYPHFLTYFNGLVGGPKNGYLYVVDSNLDWGQDLKRLRQWLDKEKINKVYLDYFGGGNPEYYLKDKFVPWRGQKNPKELPKNAYFAVSASQLQGGRGIPRKDFTGPAFYYLWTYKYEPPIAKIGNSIFIYQIH